MIKNKIKKAIISVYDKNQLELLVPFFIENKIEVYSTGGTYKYLKELDSKINIIEISKYSGFPEILNGRVKTLNSKIFAGILTDKNNIYSISWGVLLKLARISGADFIHAGMWGGYLSDTKEDLSEWMSILTSTHDLGFNKTVPSLSCGAHPGLVDTTIKNFGNNIMMSLGGSLHGHPEGTISGAKAMRQAFDLNNNKKLNKINLNEYNKAIEKWGYIDD